MYQRSSHEPRYKQSTRALEPRHAESNEYSEVSSSSSSSEEEEESSDRCTGETEEESVGIQSFREREKLQDLDRRSSPIKRISCDKFYTTPYLAVTRISKKDQFTQKNLLSPFPSYWVPPVQKEVSGGAYYRVSNIMPISEEQKSSQAGEKSSTHTPKVRESHEENEEFKKRSHNETEKKLWEKHKSGKDGRPSKTIQPEQIIRREHRESSRKLLKPLVENFSKTLGAKVSSRRPKTSSREIESSNKVIKNCPECVAVVESRSKSKRKSTVGAATSEKDPRPRDIIPSKDIGDGKLVKQKGKEVKEKLVYVVEEEGKDTKIETDIFSLNEILAIKKDLIELSEFAKKLKKLKEMKKDSESDQNKKNSCHCHPAEELLRDVNKRIEALETRQEELERKSQCSNLKGDPKLRSKKMIKSKMLSISPPKTPEAANLSAATTVPSDPKTEMLETRAEGFACNSDIVNELMDIKTQLEKLEKKRMMKEVSNEAMPQKETNLSKTKDHAIAVFSSKTYILTTENFDKAKNGKPVGEKSRKELTKENVVNWLKSVSRERTDNDVSVFLSADAKREEFKCQNYIQVSKQEDFENEEPQKNRASENLERGVDMSITCFVKNQFTEESNRFGEQKKCVVTSSERFVAVLSKSSVNLDKNPPKKCNPQLHQSADPQRLSPKIVHRSASNGSVPSTILIKRQLKKLKSQLTRKKHRNEMRVIRSKSAATTTSKIEKAPQNQKAKDSEKTESSASPSEKKHKEGKHEFLKRLEAQFMALARNLGMVDPSTTSCSYSELLASVDLETSNSKKWPENPNEKQIIMYSATKKKDSPKNKKSQGDKSKHPRKKKSCEEECKELKRRRRLEEKCKKIQETINKDEIKHEIKHREIKKETKKELKKEAKRQAKKSKPKTIRHYHHHGCRSCLLLHPWHPPCKKKSEIQKQSPTEGESSEQEKNVTSSLTDCSSSQGTQESCSYSEELMSPIRPQEPPHYTPPLCPIIKEPPPVNRCRKPKRRSGLMRTSLNLDQGLLKKFFRNIGRCYPRISDKELSFSSNKYCPEKQKRCPEHASALSESEDRCYHNANGENVGKGLRRSDPPRNQSPPAGPSALDPQNRRPTQPPRQHPQELQHPGSPLPRQLSQEPRHQRSPHFSRHPQEQHHSQEPHHLRLPHLSRHHPFEIPHLHSPHFPRHPQEQHHLRPSHTPRHYYKGPEPQHVERCECELVGAFLEDGNLSSTSSFKPFELLEDDKSKTTLRSRKTKKSKKSDSDLPKFNQVYLVNPMTEDIGKDHLFFDKPGRNSLLCVCSKCGNVHRRTENRFSQNLVDQKAIKRKLKRLDRYDPLLEQTLQEKYEDDFRREYGNYGDYNYDYNKSDQYDVRTLGYRSDQYVPHDLGPMSDQYVARDLAHTSDAYVTHDLGPTSDQSDTHKSGRKSAKRDAHKLGHKSDHHDAHKLGHKADHQDAHKLGHKSDQHNAHKLGHKADHHDAHKLGHKADHQDGHKLGHKSDQHDAHKSGHKADHHDAHKSGHKSVQHDTHKLGHKADHHDAHKLGHKSDQHATHSLGRNSDMCLERKICKKPDPCSDHKICKKPDPCSDHKICKKPDPCSDHKICKKPDPCSDHKICKKPDPCPDQKISKKCDPCAESRVCKKPDPCCDHKICKKPDPCPDQKINKKCDPCVERKICKKPDPCIDQKISKKCDLCSDHKMSKKCNLCEGHQVSHKDDHSKDHKVAPHTDCPARCCCESNKSIKSIKSKDSSKRVDTFPFLSFFSQICRLKPRKLETGDLHRTKKQSTGCDCKEKFDRLETRMTNIERGLAFHLHDEASTSKPNELRTTPQPSLLPPPPPLPSPPPSIRPNTGIERPDTGMQRPNMGLERHDMGMQRPNMGLERHDMGMQRPSMGLERHDMGMQRPSMILERHDMGMQRPNMGLETHDAEMHGPGGKKSRRSTRLDREERKINKKLMGTAWAYKKWDELERRQRLKDLKKMKKLKVSDFKRIRDREAAAFYYTIKTPSLAPSLLHPRAEDKKLYYSKSNYQFQKRINDGLSSLHSIWVNLRNHKFNYGMGNFINKMRRQPSRESDVLIDDSSRSSQMPKTREVLELKEEPTSFLKKPTKSKKSDKHTKKEKASPKSKNGRGRHK